MRTRARREAVDFDLINRVALGCMGALVERWLPGGRRRGAEWVSINPTRADRRPGSFSVNMITGKWADFATGDRGGDPVSLLAYLNRCSQGDAARALAKMLGVDNAR